MFIITAIIRLIWSLTVGLFFFALGLILFLLFDIFKPSSDVGYRILNSMYKFGSLGVFKGLRMVQDQFDIRVEKRRSQAVEQSNKEGVN
ncbi:hypothetical protein DV532_06835 [Pseudomonas sp. Leaf58]|uniref:hypothetical protein n=1 Tax=Pseudomonas sp. Leaf58 TaxID=1736226 RepID=UPI0006F5F1B7|nr:hypothetical protein [Pseudomonas sp. Leaf58]AYG44035.1 hypothetical protein DV532_06835 [Pseudomonas sp. Leaf58]KQN57113.1 hypothetical protein ASF02_26770 [Pseudomonas sp. Leaf58]